MKRFFNKANIFLFIALIAFCSANYVFAGEDNITGTLSINDDLMVLSTSSGTYTLIGQTIPDTLIGKQVRINGTIMESEDEDTKVISVDSFEEMK